MLELVKNHNQKSVIFLRKTDGGLTVASFVVFDHLNKARLVGRKILEGKEIQDLREQELELKERNIFIIEEPEISPTVLLKSGLTFHEYGELKAIIPSPYFSNLFREAEFFSTQKTRGPNQ